MNTLHLRYALEVERSGSITRAAENLYMNQPNLSKTIRELEESTGIIIFKRTPKGMVPTKKGREFLSYARNILNQVDKIESLLSYEGERKITLNVAVPRASYVSNAFTELVSSLPRETAMKIDYRETNSLKTIRDVADGEIDLGVIRFQADYESYFMDVLDEKDLEAQLLRSFRYDLLISARHPLASKETIKYADLAPFTEIVHGDSGIPLAPDSGAHSDDKRREIAIYERGSQLELLDRVPDTYMWVSPMPSYVLDRFSLVERKCDVPGNDRKDFLIYRNGHRFTETERLFAEKLMETANGSRAQNRANSTHSVS